MAAMSWRRGGRSIAGKAVGVATGPGGEIKYPYAFHVPPATKEVIHCLQSQGSPADARQRCTLRPGRHFEPGGAANAAPFFDHALRLSRLLARVPRAALQPDVRLSPAGGLRGAGVHPVPRRAD